jgi:hypothetical protein
MSSDFVIPRHIKSVELDGLTIILDTASGIFLGLDESGTRYWSRLKSLLKTQSALDDPGRRENDVGAETVRDFFDQCRTKRLLVPAADERPRPRHRPLSRRSIRWYSAWLDLVRISVSLRVRGFGPTYVMCERDVQARQAEISDKTAVCAAEQAFLAAERFFWSRTAPDDCLVRSLALFSFLRRGGLRVTHRIGVKLLPSFSSHAWVEIDDSPLLDAPEITGPYTVIASIDR